MKNYCAIKPIISKPSVDEKIYLKENVGMDNAMILLWAATNKEEYLSEGKEMLDYALYTFSTDRGIYSREEGSEPIFSFEDAIKTFKLLKQ